MRLYDAEPSAQLELLDTGTQADKPVNTFGSRESSKNGYGDFKI